MTDENPTNAALGFSPHFLSQISLEELDQFTPMRLSAIHRDRVEAISEGGLQSLSLHGDQIAGDFAVGDWVLADAQDRLHRRLDPLTEITRKSAGQARLQRIASNIDTLLIVTSCNQDFNLSRLERYLAIANDAGCWPVVVLTKTDLCDDVDAFTDQTRSLGPAIETVALSALDAEGTVQALAPWCKQGQTIALVGSSGVGKTTIANALTGTLETTQGIREDDAKGRHTTTARFLKPIKGGGWIIDTPGMRELGLADAGDAIDAVFEEIAALASQCRFRDCAHVNEPGCAVLAAEADGTLDPRRLRNWRKMKAEDLYNSETIAQMRARERAFHKHVRSVVSAKQKRKT